MTLYEALDNFEDQYLEAVESGSLREIAALESDWIKIDNEYTLYRLALIGGDGTSAQEHLDVIESILSSNDLTVDEGSLAPVSIGLNLTPDNIGIQCDASGVPKVGAYDYTVGTCYVFVGTSDDTANWTFTINSVTNCTAAIQNDDEVKVNSITDESGNVVVKGARTGYSNVYLTLRVFKIRDGLANYNLDKETDKDAAFTKTFSAGEKLEAIDFEYVSGTPYIKVGLTLGGTQVSLAELAVPTDDYLSLTVNKIFSAETIVYVTITGGVVNVNWDYRTLYF